MQFYSCLLFSNTCMHVSCYLACSRKSEFCHELFPTYKSCSSIFNSQWMLTHPKQSDLLMPSYVWQYRFLVACFFVFYPWSYILNARDFSIGLLIRSLLRSTYSVIYSEKCLLFKLILVTCPKCSMAFFSSSFYCEKIRWGRGCSLSENHFFA